MSRGSSPAPFPSLPSHPSSSSITELPRPTRPPRAPLRVDTSAILYPNLGGAGSHRNRSNSAQSRSPLPGHPAHQFSRSLSHSTVASVMSPMSPVDDVTMAVNGLRGMLSGDETLTSQTGSRVVSYRHDMPLQSKEVTEMEEDDDDDKTMKEIKEALAHSKDQGDTLDLSRRDIETINEAAVDMFKRGVGQDHKGVWRLALSYNLLGDHSLVDSFSQLSRLRYLNLKGNKLTEFPPALSDMASLEILDLSKNHIDYLPEHPGRLAKLKVLSLTRNRLTALPSYLITFTSLKVFKVDHNPITWPPKEVLGPLTNADYAQTDPETGAQKKDEDLRPWIENMKSWMRQNQHEEQHPVRRNKGSNPPPPAEEEPVSAISMDTSSTDLKRWEADSQSLDTPTPQQTLRPSVTKPESITAAASAFTSKPALIMRKRSATLSDELLNQPSSPLALPIRPFARHDRSRSNSSLTPPHSASTGSSWTHSRAPSMELPLPHPPFLGQAGHSRGASYTATQRLSGHIAAKKSLPDLRQSHAKIMQDRRNDGQVVEGARPLGLGINAAMTKRFQPPQAWPGSAKLPGSGVNPARPLSRKASSEMLLNFSNQASEGLAKRNSTEDGTLADESRNSYFRRLSTLPVSTISKAVPEVLLEFMDAIRGILFALSQLHAALRQYLLYALNSRVAGVFTRVMEPAGSYMSNLINALDRFDSMSRRSAPPAQVVKGVIESTKECIAVFSKIVAVLHLQMPALRGGDVRYTRTLLLMIYGSMTEIGCSWSAMEPLLAEVKPFLVGRPLGGISMSVSNSLTGRTPISPIPERAESRSPSSVHRSSFSTVNASPAIPHPATIESVAESAEAVESAPNSAATARVAKSRRQGGSFSMEDVERGMLMGSPGVTASDSIEDLTSMSANHTRHRPSASAQIVLEDQTEESEGEEEMLMPLPAPPFARTSRSGSVGMPTTPPEIAQHPQLIAMVPTGTSTSRRGHQANSSAGSLTSGIPGPRKLSVDVKPTASASATLYDEDLLDVIETATDIAFTVWLKLAEDTNSSNSPLDRSHAKSASQGSLASTTDSSRTSDRPSTIPVRHHIELMGLLSRAEQITASLRQTMAGIRANPSTWSQSTLADDAQSFIKTVVKVSELVKAISATHTFPQGVRQSCSRLTQATRECAILIQVSSLRPGMTTPAPIPPPSATAPSTTYRSRANTAESSAEDLTVPHSAHWMAPGSAMSSSSMSGGGGLRGLQLASKHAARRRDPGKEQPKSAQPSQIVFG